MTDYLKTKIRSDEWQHAAHHRHIGLVHVRRATQLAFPFAALLGQDVTQVRLTALEAAGAGLPEALGGTAIGFQFRHFRTTPNK
jgi:hypothetical protein